jgi:soluble cytochrome b562
VANALIEARVTTLETMMADLMTAVAQTTRAVERLSLEMSDFKEGRDARV